MPHDKLAKQLTIGDHVEFDDKVGEVVDMDACTVLVDFKDGSKIWAPTGWFRKLEAATA